MNTRFRNFSRFLLPALLLGAGTATAQLAPSEPLPSDPGRARYMPGAAQQAQQRGTAALALPFFDDFTTPLEGAPNPLKWMPSGGALVSNRLALTPLTRGAATLDGLKANGQSYSGQINSLYGPIDSLTSQPINLGGLNTSNQVFLSFAWQGGSVVSALGSNGSSSPVRLELWVKIDIGIWERAWSYTSVGGRTPFRQQVIDLNQAKYLHSDFQLRFVGYGNNSENRDNWSIDYVKLDRGRSAGLSDTTFVDAATSAGLVGGNPSGGLRSPLRRFASMPVWQYNAASPPNSELNPSLGVNLTNLKPPLPLLINAQGTVRDLGTNTVLGDWVLTPATVLSSPRTNAFTASAAGLAIPTTAAAKRLRYTLALNSQEPLSSPTIANDTISRDLELANYYAYDDGTAEGITFLPLTASGAPWALAYRFDLNQPDYVRGLRLYPVFTASNPNSRVVTISVWGDAAGRPAATPVASKTVTIPAPATYPAGWDYYQVDFDQPVPVSGTFYVGFSQPSNGRFVHYGLDLNSSFPAQHLLRRDPSGAWDTLNFVLGRGAIMMRPVMTNNVALATTAAREAAAYSLYPNPAHGSVSIEGPAFARAAVVDALGRVVWQQPAAQAGSATLPLPTLPPGLYTVRLTLADGRTIGRRLAVE